MGADHAQFADCRRLGLRRKRQERQEKAADAAQGPPPAITINT
ncbi:hypothetical protein ACEN9F_03120 [Duganella sp. CT11-25]